jgi:hypothetical protein
VPYLRIMTETRLIRNTCIGESPGFSSIWRTPWPALRLHTNNLRHFLVQEYWATSLEAVASHLWILSTQSSANVSSLHKQKVRGREILVTEDPRLHLVWINDRIFIKPLPPYLLSYQFWNSLRICCPPPRLSRRADTTFAKPPWAIFAHIIEHESDLKIAQQNDHNFLWLPQEYRTHCSAFCGDTLAIGQHSGFGATINGSWNP